jgi:predicted RNase H-like HicB family nuclease
VLQPLPQTTRRCCVLFYSEDNGYCLRAADLAGVVSEGDTVDEAVQNIKNAYAGAIESYEAHGEAVPWLVPPREPEPNEQRLCIELDC